MAERGELAQGHGVRFEEVIVRQIVALAEASGVTYSEMTRTLIDEALLARLARPGLGRETLREAVLHAIEYRGNVVATVEQLERTLGFLAEAMGRGDGRTE